MNHDHHAPAPVRVLFVCHGNICRSPIAEGVFDALVAQRGVGELFEVDSAGVSDYHVGEEPHRQSIRVCQQYGIDISGQRARQVKSHDFERFDWVIAMDRGNLRDLRPLLKADNRARVHLMLEFGDRSLSDVPDPYWGGPDGFDRVYALLGQACEGLLDHILAERPWKKGSQER